jgi:hypothetical protein
MVDSEISHAGSLGHYCHVCGLPHDFKQTWETGCRLPDADRKPPWTPVGIVKSSPRFMIIVKDILMPRMTTSGRVRLRPVSRALCRLSYSI